ncbi:hypothetical protein [Methylomonas sp. AM2-LC]|uniref:hypothetical protein n=1 Tax=Methylomonas sp. AM2-LC TaxID=3153301 RepID=UPI0032633FC0
MDHPTTAYFRNDVLVKRPYIQIDWCLSALIQTAHKEIQEDGRIRHWIYVQELGKYLRVVTLEDGITLHNAFPDRRFKP